MSKKTRPVAVHYKRGKKETLSLANDEIKKAVTGELSATDNADTKNLKGAEVGTCGLHLIESFVNLMMPYELSWPQILNTIEEMKRDDAVSTVLRLDEKLVQKAFSNYKIKFNKKSDKSKKAAELLKYNLDYLEGQTLEDVVTHACSIDAHGFSIAEKVFKKMPKGSKFGDFRLLKLANRPQRSLDVSEPWTYSKKSRKLSHFNQDPTYFQNSSSLSSFYYPSNLNNASSLTLRRNKCLLFGFGASDATPMGTSPLIGVYKAWKEKVLLEDLEMVGTSKDLA